MIHVYGQNRIVAQLLQDEGQSSTMGGVWLRAVRGAGLSDAEVARRQRQLLDLLLRLMDEADLAEGAWVDDRAA